MERKYGIAEARDGFSELMAPRVKPTAIVRGNDVLAFGALLEAQHSGISVPQSLSITGFDDLELAQYVQPALTTVRVPTLEMWRTPAARLIAAMKGEAVPRATLIEVSRVVRQSTAPVPRRQCESVRFSALQCDSASLSRP